MCRERRRHANRWSKPRSAFKYFPSDPLPPPRQHMASTLPMCHNSELEIDIDGRMPRSTAFLAVLSHWPINRDSLPDNRFHTADDLLPRQFMCPQAASYSEYSLMKWTPLNRGRDEKQNIRGPVHVDKRVISMTCQSTTHNEVGHKESKCW
jgi:hypothetical protein